MLRQEGKLIPFLIFIARKPITPVAVVAIIAGACAPRALTIR
jgi:hypothetical protein